MMNLSRQAIDERIKAVGWYHTIDLGTGVLTPGLYDHRPYSAVNAEEIDVEHLQSEIAQLQDLVRAYENGRFIRLTKWLHRHLSTFR